MIGFITNLFVNDAFFGVGVGLIFNKRADVIRIGALRETDIGAIVSASAESQKIHIQISVRSFKISPVAETVSRSIDAFVQIGIVKAAARICPDDLKFSHGFLVEAKTPVENGGVIVAFREVISRGKKSEIALPANIVFQPENSDVGVFVSEAVNAAAI